MKKLFVIILVLSMSQSSLFSQGWLWGTSISGTDFPETESVGIDSSNNIYLLNELNGTSIVQGNSVVSLGDKDIQLSKFDINGALQWTRGMGGILTDDPKALFTDINGDCFITGSFIAGIIAMLINVDILGTSGGLFKAVFNFDTAILYGRLPGTLPMFFVLSILVISKAMANCFTIGSGLSAGFTGSAMLIGLLIGSIFISIAGIDPNTPEYFAFLAAGFAGMLSSTMNTPVATAVITLELFGLAYSLPAGMASIIGFQVNRSNTLYDFAVMERKEEYE